MKVTLKKNNGVVIQGKSGEANPSPSLHSSKQAWIVSRLSHQVFIKYGDSNIVVPPQTPLGKLLIDDYSLVDDLPSGISLVLTT